MYYFYEQESFAVTSLTRLQEEICLSDISSDYVL